WDNSAIMQEIIKIRHELAQLLNFKNYAELSLATKTAKNPEEVLNFLNDLTKHTLPIAQQEFNELREFAKTTLGINQLQPWDIAYASEQLRQKKFAFSEEELRAYFPEDHVLKGLFTIDNQLFGIRVQEKQNVASWHPDVKFFEVYDENNNLLGQFY